MRNACKTLVGMSEDNLGDLNADGRKVSKFILS
jgi:hypothetical protein